MMPDPHPRQTRADVLEARRAQYGARAMSLAVRAVQAVEGAGGGERGKVLFAEARSLFGLVLGGVLGRGEVVEALGRASTLGKKEKDSVLRRAESRARPRYLPDEGFTPSAGARSRPLSPVPFPERERQGPASDADTARAARAAVSSAMTTEPSDWPADILAWCDAVGVSPSDAAALGCGVFGSRGAADVGKVAGEAAGVYDALKGRWADVWRSGTGRVPCLWIPAWGASGVPSGWALRLASPIQLDEGKTLRMVRTAQATGAGWWPFVSAVEGSAGTVIVEGEKDWLIMAGPARAVGLSVVGLPGAQWQEAWGSLVSGPVLVALDADDAGDKAAAHVLAWCEAAGVSASRARPSAKDWGDIVAGGGSPHDIARGWREALDTPSPTSAAAALFERLRAALCRDVSAWPSELRRGIGAAGCREILAWGGGWLGEAARAAVSAASADVLAAAGIRAGDSAWAGAVPVALVPRWSIAGRDVAAFAILDAVGSVRATREVAQGGPLGWACPFSERSRPVVIVRDALDALAIGEEAEREGLEVWAMYQTWQPEWARLLEGRPVGLFFAGWGPWPAGEAALGDLRALGLDVRHERARMGQTWREVVRLFGRRQVWDTFKGVVHER